MTELLEITKLGLKKFDGVDFALWKYRIEIALTTAGCKDTVADVFDQLNNMNQFENFKEFMSYYELLTGNKIKEFRIDNGKEYMSNEFKDFLKEKGIKHNTSVTYCPQSNGKAERLNRTLLEKSSCMLMTANVHINLWGAAIHTANYLRNVSPSSVLKGKSPYEALFNKQPKLKHLRIFGCDAYPLILNGIRDKFGGRAKKHCIMIGYGEKTGIYWILEKETNKVFRTRDVKFNENPILNVRISKGILIETSKNLTANNERLAEAKNSLEDFDKKEIEKFEDSQESDVEPSE